MLQHYPRRPDDFHLVSRSKAKPFVRLGPKGRKGSRGEKIT
jgi:hypothetical protein